MAASRRPSPSALILHVALAEITPPIWRRVQVPAAFSVAQLHRVLQFCFGWLDAHLYAFKVGSRRFAAPDPEADGEDAESVTLASLRLRLGSRLAYTYDFGDDWHVTLRVEAVAPVPCDLEPWEVLRVFEGARAGPPEDCGGVPGYEDLLRILASPRDPEHAARQAWLGGPYDPEAFDPWLLTQHLRLAAAWTAI